MDPGARLDDLAAAASAAEPVFVAAADERGLARVHDIRAYVHDLRGENTELEQEALLGLEHAQRAGDERLANEMRWYLAWAARSGPTHVDVAIARCREIAARGDAATQLHALFSIAFLQAQTGKFEEAHASADRAGELLREFGLGAWADGDVTTHGLIAMLEGDYPSAEHLFRAAYERAVERGRSIGYRAGWLAQALCALGRHDEAMELSRIAEEQSSEGVVEQVGWRVARAKALAGEGAIDAALRFAADAVAVARASDDVPSRGRALLTLAELLSLVGRVEEARAVAVEAVEVHDRKGLSVPAARAQVLVEQSGSPVA